MEALSRAAGESLGKGAMLKGVGTFKRNTQGGWRRELETAEIHPNRRPEGAMGGIVLEPRESWSRSCRRGSPN